MAVKADGLCSHKKYTNISLQKPTEGSEVPKNPDAIVHLAIRFPEHVRRRLEYAAHENARSMNSEISFRLAQSFERDAAARERVAWMARLFSHVLAAADGKCSEKEALERIATQLTTTMPKELS